MTLKCKSKSQDLAVEWRHKGKVLRSTHLFKHKIDQCEAGHEGIYSCQVKRFDGNYTFSLPITLKLPQSSAAEVPAAETSLCYSSFWVDSAVLSILYLRLCRLCCGFGCDAITMRVDGGEVMERLKVQY